MDYVTPLIPTAVFSDLGTRDDNSEIVEMKPSLLSISRTAPTMEAA